MKLLVFSDSHRYTSYMIRAARLHASDTDLFVHLGDMISDAEELKREFEHIPVIAVPGNGDYFFHPEDRQMEREVTITLETIRIWMLHGHTRHVKNGLGLLSNAARQKEAGLVLFGHTHECTTYYEDGIYYLNPGSIRYVHESRMKPTYGIVEIRNGSVLCSIGEV